MLNVFSNPTPEHARLDLTNSINQIVFRMEQLLPQYGVTLVNSHADAGLFVCHAGIGDGHRADVAHISGLYPTHHFPEHAWHWEANAHVIENVRRAKIVTVPSQWVADLFARDMHIQCEIIEWGVDTNEWQPPIDDGNPPTPYVLWNKTRVDGICDPQPMNALAALLPNVQFVSTFGAESHNVRLTGRMPYPAMGTLVRHAGIYLATTLETFGIGTLEAMACGVPILGYNWGGTGDLVRHGVTGYLVEPGDIEGLAKGYAWLMKHRAAIGNRARTVAKMFSWDTTARKLADIYHRADDLNTRRREPDRIKVSVVVPCYNYEKFVGSAIASIAAQSTKFNYEMIVVNDNSTDESEKAIVDAQNAAIAVNPRVRATWLTNTSNLGVAETRNKGVRAAHGEYIVCLDADDMLASPSVLQTFADALDAAPELGIAYGALRMMDSEGNVSSNATSWPNKHDFEQHLQRHNQVPTMCMFRKEAWQKTGGYRTRFQPAEDAQLWTWIGALGYRAAMVTPEPTLLYRLHGGSLSADVREGRKPEPDWLFDFRWSSNPNVGRPFACDGRPMRGSWAVRNYCLPAVSVIIPCSKNHLPLLMSAIDSVESQTYPFWELIVVLDDPQSRQLNIKTLADRAPFVRWIYAGGNGAGAARNVGANYARAGLLTFLDADDMLHPEFLAETIKEHRRTGKYVYTDWRSENKKGEFELNQCPDYDPALVFQRTSIHAVNILIDRDVFLSAGGFDESMPAWEDTDLQMRLPTLGHFGTRVPKPLFLYRYGTGQRRELGETIKQQLIDKLKDRYLDYIEGRKMCICNTPNGVHFPPQFGFTDSGNAPLESEVVRIMYTGGAGSHKVIGAATKTDYRDHQYGDYFVIYRADLEAQPHYFKVEAELPILPRETPIPPDPVFA